jgi:hypothetical protein
MKRDDVRNIIKGIHAHFRAPLSPGVLEGITSSLLPQLSHYSLEHVERVATGIIRGRKPTPGNCPSMDELLDLCGDAHKSATAGNTKYDREEDYRYPIDGLLKGFEILQEDGDDDFKRYADKTGMPENDRRRVRYRASVIARRND